jgi:imidazolonepropionase-like amidohydrolase
MVTECGLSPADSVRAATAHAATLLRRAHELGRVDVGACADVIACPGDPFDDITELTRVSFVMKGGHVHRHDAAA